MWGWISLSISEPHAQSVDTAGTKTTSKHRPWDSHTSKGGVRKQRACCSPSLESQELVSSTVISSVCCCCTWHSCLGCQQKPCWEMGRHTGWQPGYRLLTLAVQGALVCVWPQEAGGLLGSRRGILVHKEGRALFIDSLTSLPSSPARYSERSLRQVLT